MCLGTWGDPGRERPGRARGQHPAKGQLAKTNAQQVSRIRGILESLSLEIATPAEARAMLIQCLLNLLVLRMEMAPLATTHIPPTFPDFTAADPVRAFEAGRFMALLSRDLLPISAAGNQELRQILWYKYALLVMDKT